jgi:hydrogenase maturation protein HypF
MLVAEIDPLGERDFAIRESQAQEGEFALVSPDVATCPDCYRDFTDPANRRYGYAFTNCTNCGPRYTIIRDIPYDRPTPPWPAFACARRARRNMTIQAIGVFMRSRTRARNAVPQLSAAVAEAQQRLSEGQIVAIRGWADSTWRAIRATTGAVRLLRERKRRSDKPFALMARDLAAVEAFCTVSDDDRRALIGPRRPIVILPRRRMRAFPRRSRPATIPSA